MQDSCAVARITMGIRTYCCCCWQWTITSYHCLCSRKILVAVRVWSIGNSVIGNSTESQVHGDRPTFLHIKVTIYRSCKRKRAVFVQKSRSCFVARIFSSWDPLLFSILQHSHFTVPYFRPVHVAQNLPQTMTSSQQVCNDNISSLAVNMWLEVKATRHWSLETTNTTPNSKI